jgi:hypothetical protein
LTLCVFGVLSLINFTINFKTDKQKRNKNIIIFAACCILVLFLGGLNTVFIVKLIYDNRSKIANTADELINTAIDKTVEYTVRGAMGTAQTFSRSYNASVIKQFENLDISFSSSKFELDKEKEQKIYEIEVILDNKIQRNEEIYFGSLVQKNYLIACDVDDFVYRIIPEDSDGGYIKERELIALVEFFMNREYTKFGKILPGKSLHKILVVVPKDVEISYLMFLDKRIDVVSE